MLNKLQKFRQDLKKKGKGFTLVELIVVIIIIAIIAAVAIPNTVSWYQQSSLISEHKMIHQMLRILLLQIWHHTFLKIPLKKMHLPL